MLKESNTTYQDGTPVQQPYSEMEKQLCRDYPNFGPTMWSMVKNVNIVMKVMIGMFVLQGALIVGYMALMMK